MNKQRILTNSNFDKEVTRVSYPPKTHLIHLSCNSTSHTSVVNPLGNERSECTSKDPIRSIPIFQNLAGIIEHDFESLFNQTYPNKNARFNSSDLFSVAQRWHIVKNYAVFSGSPKLLRGLFGSEAIPGHFSCVSSSIVRWSDCSDFHQNIMVVEVVERQRIIALKKAATRSAAAKKTRLAKKSKKAKTHVDSLE